MNQYRCGICEKSYNSINSAAECESSCLALDEQYRAYYGVPSDFPQVITKKPTTVVIEMPNDVVIRITSGEVVKTQY